MDIRIQADNNKFLCANDNVRGIPAPERPIFANRKGADAWETFRIYARGQDGVFVPLEVVIAEMIATAIAVLEPKPPAPGMIDPIDGVWPPPEGTPRVRPPDVATTDPVECRRQLRWALWVANTNDNESYWMDAIVLNPEKGHAPGWVNDPYWYGLIAQGNGAGLGYLWPPT